MLAKALGVSVEGPAPKGRTAKAAAKLRDGALPRRRMVAASKRLHYCRPLGDRARRWRAGPEGD